jgi:sugar phosphate isomerase/epimerase
MTIGISVSTFPTKFGPIMFSENLEQKLHRIAALGFNSLDLFIQSSDEPGLSNVVREIQRMGLKVAIVAAVSAFVEEGLYLSALDEDIRSQMLARMKGQIEFAASLQADVPIGVLRGSQGGEAYLEMLARSIQELYAFAAPLGVELILEPVNRYETSLINSIQDAVEFIDQFSLPPVKLLPDTFHMNIEDADFSESLKLAGDRIGHIHFADSNRAVPGKGHLQWDMIGKTLSEIGYSGTFGLETIPGDNPYQDAADGFNFTKHLLEKYSLVGKEKEVKI